MHSIRHSSARWLLKALPACTLAILSLPAHSVWLEGRNGLSLQMYTSVSPSFSKESNTFTYTGSPRIFGEWQQDQETNAWRYDVDADALQKALANQDRKDADERLRLSGNNLANVEFTAYQVLTKDLSVQATTSLDFDDSGTRNYGAYWGVSLFAKNLGGVTVGTNSSGLFIGQTRAENLLTANGTKIRVDYNKIPDLNISAYHMFTAANDNRSNRDIGLHKSNGISASYEYSFAPRQVLKVGAGINHGKGHEDQYWNRAAKSSKAGMFSVGYQHQDLTIAVDAGKRTEEYNGNWFNKVDTDVIGTQISYEITPRLTTTFNYDRKVSKSDTPVRLSNLISAQTDINESLYFNKVTRHNYGIGVNYQLYKGISLFGNANRSNTHNYLSTGEFSKRKLDRYNAGVSFVF